MQLHPCGCGEQAFPWTRHTQAQADDGVATVYEGHCPRCGQPRSFIFLVPAAFVPPPAFGAGSPSEIVDPSEFLRLAEGATRDVPAALGALSAEPREAALDAVDVAIAAIDEVLKFVPPGARGVPRELFLTDAGRAAFDARPARYGVEQLAATRRYYDDLRARLG
jgi:hypothetical protein